MDEEVRRKKRKKKKNVITLISKIKRINFNSENEELLKNNGIT